MFQWEPLWIITPKHSLMPWSFHRINAWSEWAKPQASRFPDFSWHSCLHSIQLENTRYCRSIQFSVCDVVKKMHLSVKNAKRQSLFEWVHINKWEAICMAASSIICKFICWPFSIGDLLLTPCKGIKQQHSHYSHNTNVPWGLALRVLLHSTECAWCMTFWEKSRYVLVPGNPAAIANSNTKLSRVSYSAMHWSLSAFWASMISLRILGVIFKIILTEENYCRYDPWCPTQLQERDQEEGNFHIWNCLQTYHIL